MHLRDVGTGFPLCLGNTYHFSLHLCCIMFCVLMRESILFLFTDVGGLPYMYMYMYWVGASAYWVEVGLQTVQTVQIQNWVYTVCPCIYIFSGKVWYYSLCLPSDPVPRVLYSHLSYDVARWITSCHKNRMTTRLTRNVFQRETVVPPPAQSHSMNPHQCICSCSYNYHG